jgi:hypothetical protein
MSGEVAALPGVLAPARAQGDSPSTIDLTQDDAYGAPCLLV